MKIITDMGKTECKKQLRELKKPKAVFWGEKYEILNDDFFSLTKLKNNCEGEKSIVIFRLHDIIYVHFKS